MVRAVTWLIAAAVAAACPQVFAQAKEQSILETITIDATKRRLGVSVNGRPPFEIALPPHGGAADKALLDLIATDIRDAINAVAGAGTGKVPCAHFTVPLPTLSGDATTRSTPSHSIP